MSHKRMKDVKVTDLSRKEVDGVVDPTKEIEGGWMDEGEIMPPTSELYTKDYQRGDD